MLEENVLFSELDKLDIARLKSVAQVWNIAKLGKDKKTITKNIIAGMKDDFNLRGVLEKLSATQVTIYLSIVKSGSNILTLGEISRKISLPPVNTEMELGVLKRYFLVYQRKNRERLTNNMDKYYYYPETGERIRFDTNSKGEKFKLQLSDILKEQHELHPMWKGILQKGSEERAKEPENLKRVFAKLGDLEKELILESFLQGGLLEIVRARDFIAKRKGKWEEMLRNMHASGLLLDEYYIDERFIRVLVLPADLFRYLQLFPIVPREKRGTRKRQERRASNNLDFFLNIKKMIVYISRKGLNLAKSGKIKQVDLKETENRLLRPDIELFIEKSQIYQIELLLPVMRLLDIVRIKKDDVVLRNDFTAILTMDIFELRDIVIKEMASARDRRVRYEDVFEPLYVPFYQKEFLNECVEYIQKQEKVLHFVVMAAMVRDKLVLSKEFRIKNFQTDLSDLRKEITSALFYLQLLGLIVVEYPDRWVEISDLGLHYFRKRHLATKDEAGGVIINPDLSLIAIPEKLSLKGTTLLKSFTELKSFDNVYTFQITRESFQEGMLLKGSTDEFVDLLRRTSKNELSQNLLFSVDDWSNSLPLVTITDECVVVQAQDSNHMELLLGQISGKKIVVEKISPTTILIDSEKIYEAIAYAEKLNLIVRLIR